MFTATLTTDDAFAVIGSAYSSSTVRFHPRNGFILDYAASQVKINVLKLQNVVYIPTLHTNLVSFGRAKKVLKPQTSQPWMVIPVGNIVAS